MSKFAEVRLVDKAGRGVYVTRDCPQPYPSVITYGGRTFVDAGFWRSLRTWPFRIYQEGLATWDAGGPLG